MPSGLEELTAWLRWETARHKARETIARGTNGDNPANTLRRHGNHLKVGGRIKPSFCCRCRQVRLQPRREERGAALLRRNDPREWRGGQGDAFGFGAVRTPVFGREGDAPEARGRLKEFDTYFRFTGLHDPGSRYRSWKLLTRAQVTDGEQLAHQNSLAQLQERAVGVDNRSTDFLGKPLAIGANPGHKNSDRQQDALATTLVRIPVRPSRTSTQ